MKEALLILGGILIGGFGVLGALFWYWKDVYR